jgi:hypothetical protein
MATTLRHLRGPLIAFAAIFAASLPAGQASACSMMEPAKSACATACGCCSSATSQAPATPVGMAEPVALRPTPIACETAPGRGCSCSSREPAAPAPKPARSTAEGRTEPGHITAFAVPGEDHAARLAPSSQLPLTQGPPKVPLYLRNERLLF